MIKPAMLHQVPTTARLRSITPQQLDIFRHERGKAAFFMLGQHIEAHPAIAAAARAGGHEIGNHTYTHPRLTSLVSQALRA